MPTNTNEPIVLDDEDQEIIRRVHFNVCGCRSASCRTREALNSAVRLVVQRRAADEAARFEQVRERNLRALQHEAETPMRGHTATCCAAAAVGSA